MADDTTHTTTTPNHGTHTTTTTTTSGGGGTAFILGGVVVLLAILAWLFLGGDVSTTSDSGTSATVNIEAAPATDDGGDAAVSAADTDAEAGTAAETTTAN